MVKISSNPYLASDFAFLPCLRILIGLISISLCSPTRYAHTRATHTIATSLAMRSVSRMCVLNVESGGFHGLEGRLDLPAFLISHDSPFGTVEAYEDLQFRNPVGVFYPTACKIDILPLVEEGLMVKLLLPDPEVIEEPSCTDPLTGGRPDNPEVLTDAYVIPDTTAVEPSGPFLPDELAVCHEAVDTVRSEKSDEPLHDYLTFLLIGIPPFGKKVENQRKGNPFVCHAQHKDIDVGLPELPVGAVHAQHQFSLDRKQRENHAGDDVEVKNILGEESLKPSEVGIPVNGCRHRAGQFMETDHLHDTQRVKEKRHELYARQIHTLSKMLLHNRENLVNFDQVLGISSFHVKKRLNFSFKLLNSRDFYKYNKLKFRCLTA